MGWFVCPVDAVRGGLSAVDLRICTDASNLCSTCIEELVGGLTRIFVLKRLGALTGICDVMRLRKVLLPKSSTGHALAVQL